MGTNHFFNHFNNSDEQRLIEDLVAEMIKYGGVDCFYMPRTFVNVDNIFGEDLISSFNDAFPLELYISSVDGFEGDGDFIAKFGLETRDTVKFVVSKYRFTQETNREKPWEGVLIFLPFNSGIFEIKFAEHEKPFYQFGENYVFELSCELFSPSHEDMITGVDAIDDVIDGEQYTLTLFLDSLTGNSAGFAKGDTVYQPVGGGATGTTDASSPQATVFSVSGTGATTTSLTLIDTKGFWRSGLTGTKNFFVATVDNSSFRGITGTEDSISITGPNTSITADSDNQFIEEEALGFVDFTDTNPFGEF